jgi:hypothetical protein
MSEFLTSGLVLWETYAKPLLAGASVLLAVLLSMLAANLYDKAANSVSRRTRMEYLGAAQVRMLQALFYLVFSVALYL